MTRKVLEFLDDYAVAFLEDHTKTKTFRLGDRSAQFKPGDIVDLMVKGREAKVASAKITAIIIKNFGDITCEDIPGSGHHSLPFLCTTLDMLYVEELKRIPRLEDTTIFSIITWTYLK